MREDRPRRSRGPLTCKEGHPVRIAAPHLLHRSVLRATALAVAGAFFIAVLSPSVAGAAPAGYTLPFKESRQITISRGPAVESHGVDAFTKASWEAIDIPFGADSTGKCVTPVYPTAPGQVWETQDEYTI